MSELDGQTDVENETKMSHQKLARSWPKGWVKRNAASLNLRTVEDTLWRGWLEVVSTLQAVLRSFSSRTVLVTYWLQNPNYFTLCLIRTQHNWTWSQRWSGRLSTAHIVLDLSAFTHSFGTPAKTVRLFVASLHSHLMCSQMYPINIFTNQIANRLTEIWKRNCLTPV